ncbi:cupin domain-containing protein [Candidatus Woesearchaeota archaeon]|nr:cupin domain-containing protein [Candidatus Woesearchaeota archaeon]
MNYTKNLLELVQFPKQGIYSTVLQKGDGYNYTLMCLSKDTDIDTHTSTKQGVVQVLSGKGKFKLLDEDIDMEPGRFIYMPKNAPHSLYAEEDTALLLVLHD